MMLSGTSLYLAAFRHHQDNVAEDWAHYAEACLTHDGHEPVVTHASELETASSPLWKPAP